MGTYILSANNWRKHTLNDKNEVTAYTDYVKGQEVELEDDAPDTKRLLNAGAVVTKEDWESAVKERKQLLDANGGIIPLEERFRQNAAAMYAPSSLETFGNTATAMGDTLLRDPEPQGLVGEQEVTLDEETGQVTEVEQTDKYGDESEYTYGDLQNLAKLRSLAANGSRTDLVMRLREWDRTQADEKAIGASQNA